MLTDLKLKRYKPKGKREILWDRGGLGFRIGRRKKTWVFRYSFNNKRFLMAFGEYPLISLEEARQKAAEYRILIKKGIDPLAEKLTEKRARMAAPTFKEALDEYYHNILEKTPSGKERKRLVTKDCIKNWGHRKIADITRRDIAILLNEVTERAPVTANRLHGVLTGLFNYCAENGIIENSPCAGMSRRTKERPRKRVLSDDEIKAMWQALNLENKTVDIYNATKLALKMILLTGQRPGEVVGMKWEDLDLKARIWNNRVTKTRKDEEEEPNRVPLTRLAIEVVEQARAHSGKSAFVFRSSHRNGPITRAALGRALIRHWEEIEGIEKPFTPHDLRRTLRSRLAELGIDNIIAERILGHKLQGMLAVYNQHPYDQEMRHALEAWEIRLRLIVGLDIPNAKVIPLKRK